MAHTPSLSPLPRNGHSIPYVELRQSLPSKVAAVSPFVEQLMRFVRKRPEWTALTSGMRHFSVQMVTLDQVR